MAINIVNNKSYDKNSDRLVALYNNSSYRTGIGVRYKDTIDNLPTNIKLGVIPLYSRDTFKFDKFKNVNTLLNEDGALVKESNILFRYAKYILLGKAENGLKNLEQTAISKLFGDRTDSSRNPYPSVSTNKEGKVQFGLITKDDYAPFTQITINKLGKNAPSDFIILGGGAKINYTLPNAYKENVGGYDYFKQLRDANIIVTPNNIYPTYLKGNDTDGDAVRNSYYASNGGKIPLKIFDQRNTPSPLAKKFVDDISTETHGDDSVTQDYNLQSNIVAGNDSGYTNFLSRANLTDIHNKYRGGDFGLNLINTDTNGGEFYREHLTLNEYAPLVDKDKYYRNRLNMGGTDSDPATNDIDSIYDINTIDAQPDFVKFYFKLGTEILQFRNTVANLNYSIRPEWQPVDYIGNPSRHYIYDKIERNMSLDFMVVANHPNEMKGIYKNINRLAQLVAPSFNNLGVMSGNILLFTFGDFIVDEKCIIDSVDMSVADNYVWDIGLNNVNNKNNIQPLTLSVGKELPMYIDVSIDLVLLGNSVLNSNSNFFGYVGV
jgi:hypothetical protein